MFTVKFWHGSRVLSSRIVARSASAARRFMKRTFVGIEIISVSKG